ncbi:MAG: alpha/beta fold hydrolase [Planctomycetes bacterium]|nr:alpha/beta fold hydrolase [Planctomycetota bacterium]
MLPLYGTLLAPLLLQGPEHASPDLRYELGLRVQEMERAFEHAQEQPQLRRDALPVIEKSVNAFFSLDLPGAARALDEARAQLAGKDLNAYDCLSVAPNMWMLEPGDSFRLTVAQIYPADLPHPITIHVPKAKKSFEVKSLPFTYDYGPITSPEGPYGTSSELYGFSYGELPAIYSANPEVVPNARKRARTVQNTRSASIDTLAPWVTATTRLHLEILSGMLRGDSFETKLPGEFLLHRSEQLLVADQKALQVPGGYMRWLRQQGDEEQVRKRSGSIARQEWIALPRERGRDVVRLQWPESKEEQPPLVIALHGMGGSENLFFEGYGFGKAARKANTLRGFLAAPRVDAGFKLASVTQQLVEMLNADPKRIFVLGHSMGAQTALSAAALLEEAGIRIAGMVLIGGGRPANDAATLVALGKIPILVQAGEKDFARPGAEALIAQLEESSHPTLVGRIVPDTEHLTIVQVALDEAFDWIQWLLNRHSE